jgi:hypothetical protein
MQNFVVHYEVYLLAEPRVGYYEEDENEGT